MLSVHPGGFEVKQGSPLTGFPDLDDLDDVSSPPDISPEERERREKQFEIASCVGHIVAAGTLHAGLALHLQAAWEDCEEVYDFYFNEFLEDEADDVKDVLDAVRNGAFPRRNASTTERPRFRRKRLDGAIRRQELRNLRAICARDISSVVRDAAAIAALMQAALKNCGGPDATCGQRIAAAIRTAAGAAQDASEMQVACPPDFEDFPHSFKFRDLFACSETIEAVGWSFDGFLRQISEASVECPGKERENPKFDPVTCAGEVVSSLCYLSASGMSLTSAIRRDCIFGRAFRDVNYTRLKKRYPKEYLRVVKLLDVERTRCARDITSFVRTLFIAAWKATRAAGRCGGFDTMCGVDIARSAAGLAAAAQSASNQRQHCFQIELRETDEEYIDREIDRVKCAVSSSSLVKELGVTAGFWIDAFNSCGNTTYAKIECGANIAKIFAILGYLAENSADIQRKCILDSNRFDCGRRIDRIGTSLNLLPRAIAGAVVNCGLGTIERITKPLSLPRRFWVPVVS